MSQTHAAHRMLRTAMGERWPLCIGDAPNRIYRRFFYAVPEHASVTCKRCLRKLASCGCPACRKRDGRELPMRGKAVRRG